MGWYLRKSMRFGPMRINLSRRGIGVSVGIKGLRVGTGPRGPYVAGGRGGIYFRQRPGGPKRAASRAAPSPTPHLLTAQAVPPPPLTSPTGQPLAPPPAAPTPQREIPPPRYPTWALFALSGAYGLGFLLASVGTGVGAALLTIISIAVCMLDWRGFTTLDGRIIWGRLNGWQRTGLIIAYLYFFIMAGVYLGFACRDWLVARRAANQRAPLEQQRRISELESQLGILPQTEGACRACHKPLQVGAAFCAYCRAPVREQARVCSACGTAALPDGQFCPTCGADL